MDITSLLSSATADATPDNGNTSTDDDTIIVEQPEGDDSDTGQGDPFTDLNDDEGDTDNSDDESGDEDPDASGDDDVTGDKTGKDDLNGDGPVPAKYKDLFKKDPQLKAMYFANQAFRKAFPTPAAAQEFVSAVENFGGVEGIQTQFAEFAAVDEMFAKGDKGALDKFLAKPENAEGFAKLGPALMDEFRTRNEPAWSHEIAKTMIATLRDSGVINGLAQLKDLVKEEPKAAELVDAILKNFSGINELAKAPAKPTVDPARQKLDEDRKAFEMERAKAFDTEVNHTVATGLDKAIAENIAQYYPSGVEDADKAVLSNLINGELVKLIKADPNFDKQLKAVYATKDKARIAKFYDSTFRKHLAAATKQTVRSFRNLSGGKADEPKPKAGIGKPDGKGKPGTKHLKAPPAADKIDRAKTSHSMFFSGKAWLKDGSFVTFD